MLYFDQFYVPEKNNEHVILRGKVGQKCRTKFLHFEPSFSRKQTLNMFRPININSVLFFFPRRIIPCSIKNQ